MEKERAGPVTLLFFSQDVTAETLTQKQQKTPQKPLCVNQRVNQRVNQNVNQDDHIYSKISSPEFRLYEEMAL
ncbi:MAG: hypothetical protein IJZ70_00040 [Bacteroidales bacterium]|nr:hypothetical protein [Bacteroidales bacterium]